MFEHFVLGEIGDNCHFCDFFDEPIRAWIRNQKPTKHRHYSCELLEDGRITDFNLAFVSPIASLFLSI